MAYVHRCVFCEHERPASSPTLTRPHCERCGSLLVAEKRDEGPALETRGMPALPPLPPHVERALTLAAVASVVGSGAATGMHLGGPWIAVAGFAAAGLAGVGVLRPGRDGS